MIYILLGLDHPGFIAVSFFPSLFFSILPFEYFRGKYRVNCLCHYCYFRGQKNVFKLKKVFEVFLHFFIFLNYISFHIIVWERCMYFLSKYFFHLMNNYISFILIIEWIIYNKIYSYLINMISYSLFTINKYDSISIWLASFKES
jgi:hypothetical protein